MLSSAATYSGESALTLTKGKKYAEQANVGFTRNAGAFQELTVTDSEANVQLTCYNDDGSRFCRLEGLHDLN